MNDPAVCLCSDELTLTNATENSTISGESSFTTKGIILTKHEQSDIWPTTGGVSLIHKKQDSSLILLQRANVIRAGISWAIGLVDAKAQCSASKDHFFTILYSVDGGSKQRALIRLIESWKEEKFNITSKLL
jgi:hypothetical protein